MARKKKGETVTGSDGQQRLACFFEEQMVETRFLNYSVPRDSPLMKLRVTDKVLDKFNDLTSKETKRGPRYTPEEIHLKRLYFIYKRAVPVENVKIEGKDWQDCINSFYRDIFKDDPEKRFDSMGQNAEEIDKVPVADNPYEEPPVTADEQPEEVPAE